MEENQEHNISPKRRKGKYRLAILNDELFEEKFSMRISLLGIFVFLLGLFIVITICSIYLIGSTTLREYIPGYGEVGVKDSLFKLQKKMAQISDEMDKKDVYINNVVNIIQGKTTAMPANIKRDTTIDYSKLKMDPGPNDSILRLRMELRDRYKLYLKDKSVPTNPNSSFSFFSPVKGMVTNTFNLSQGHYGVDITGKEDEIIKATMDGTVVFAGFSITDGYVIQIQHRNNMISAYKHNSDLTKKAGDRVKAGDPIAIIGNSGETKNGMHLHFELWYNGSPLNPQDYIVF